MLVVRVSGVKRYKDRHGKLRVYHRASGTAIDPALMGAALAQEVARLDRLHSPMKARAGTLAGLLESYKASPRFVGLKPRTKADYRKIMDYLAPMGDMPLTTLGPGMVAKLRDKAKTAKRAGFTNHMLAMLAAAFAHGVEYEIVERNPVLGIGKAKMDEDRLRPNRAWTPEERANVCAVAWDQLRLPLALARFLGIRRGDIVAMPLQAYSDGWLTFRTGKTGKLMHLPVLGTLRREIERELVERQKHENPALLLCLNTRGKQWTANGLGVQLDRFFTECRERGLMGAGGSIHGLRHSVGAELRGAGYDKEMRKLILGHDTDDMAEHYSASADVTGQLIDMARRLDTGSKLA